MRPVGSIVEVADGTFAVVGGAGELTPHPVPEAQRAELRALLGLRDTLLALRALRDGEATPAEWGRIGALRAELNERYDAYAQRFGAINRFSVRRQGWVPTAEFHPPQGGFGADPSAAAVRALECFDRARNAATKAKIFDADPARPDAGDRPAR